MDDEFGRFVSEHDPADAKGSSILRTSSMERNSNRCAIPKRLAQLYLDCELATVAWGTARSSHLIPL